MGSSQHPPGADETPSADVLAPVSEADLPGPLPGRRCHAPNDAGLRGEAAPWWRDRVTHGLLWENRAQVGAGELGPPPTSSLDSVARSQLSESQTALPSGTFYSGPVQSSPLGMGRTCALGPRS